MRSCGFEGFGMRFRDEKLRLETKDREQLSEEQLRDRCLHGEIYFEETRHVAKYIILPDEVTDPTFAIKTFVNLWQLEWPKMLITAEESFKNEIIHRLEFTFKGDHIANAIEQILQHPEFLDEDMVLKKSEIKGKRVLPKDLWAIGVDDFWMVTKVNGKRVNSIDDFRRHAEGYDTGQSQDGASSGDVNDDDDAGSSVKSLTFLGAYPNSPAYRKAERWQKNKKGEGVKTEVGTRIGISPRLISGWQGKPKKMFKSKFEGIARAVATAALECDAWFLGKNLGVQGGAAGDMFGWGFDQDNDSRVFLKLDVPIENWCQPKLFQENELREQLRVNAVPLDSVPQNQVFYPDNDSVDVSIWNTKLKAKMSPYATHYVIGKVSENLYERLTSVFPTAMLLSSGLEQYQAPQRIIDAARKGTQVVVMENTGFVADAIAYQVKKARAKRRMEPTDNIKNACRNTVLWVKLPPLAEDVPLQNFVILDAAKDSSEKVISKLTMTMSSFSSNGMNQIGFAQGEKRRLLYAWNMYLMFTHNEVIQRWWSDFLQFTIIFISLSTTAAAVMYVYFSVDHEEEEFTIDALAVACGCLPLVSGSLLSIQAHFSPYSKWVFLRRALTRIQKEIYRYRSRVSEYSFVNNNASVQRLMGEFERVEKKTSVFREQVQDKEPEKQGDVTEKVDKDITSVQQVFAETVESVHTELMSSDWRSDALQKPNSDAFQNLRRNVLYPAKMIKDDTGLQFDPSSDKGKDSTHINLEEAGKEIIRQMESLVLDVGKEADLHSDFNQYHSILSDEGLVDDGMSVVTPDDYVLFRLEPHILRFGQALPYLSIKYNVLSISLFFATLASAVLAFLDYNIFIPLVVAFASSVSSWIEYTQCKQHLLVMNESLTALRNTKLWWHSLSMVQQRMPENKEHLVEATEAAIEAEGSSFMKSLAQRRKSDGKGDKTEDEDAKK